MKYEITDRDGRKRIVDGDDDIVPDGGSVRVPMMFRDAAMSPLQKVVADASANVDMRQCAHQPGHVLSDAAAREIKERAYQDAKRELSDAWRTPTSTQSVGDGRRRHKVVSRDPEGRETGSAEWEEEDAVPGGQREGDVCTINGAPGHLNAKLECVPDRMDAAAGLKRKQDAYDAMVADMCDAWRTRA